MLIKRLIGTGVAVITPFKTDGSIDFDALKNVVNYIVDNGVEYIVALGTTGETPTLRQCERDVIVRIIIEEVKERVPVIVGVGGNCTADCVDTLKNSDFSGVSGILSVVPYYNKPSQEGLFRHFSMIAEASPVPVILYNIPSRCGTNMEADTTLRLANTHANIIAIKEASGNMEQIKDLIQRKPQNFEVISGDDGLALQIVEAGGAGVISVLGNARPKEISTMVRTALKGDIQLAQQQLDTLQDLIKLAFAEGNPTGIKAMTHVLGFCENQLRLPLVACSDSLLTQIRTALEPFTKR